MVECAALRDEAGRTGAKIFFAGESRSRADAELRGKWVLKGEPAPVVQNLSSPVLTLVLLQPKTKAKVKCTYRWTALSVSTKFGPKGDMRCRGVLFGPSQGSRDAHPTLVLV